MYYILDPDFIIRKWQGSPAFYLYKGSSKRRILQKDAYELVKKCDGNTEITPCFQADKLEVSGMIHPCEKASVSLLPDQIKEYPNYSFENIDWNLLDQCNYNCLHCFHAADNTMQRDSFSYEEAMRFLDDMVSCGIPGVRLTGGEPTLYPYFREVLQGIRDRGLRLTTLITNGSRLGEELVSLIKGLHPDAEIRISFDGIGYHDWLRQHPGAEERAKKAIRICKNAGLYVMINMNVNRKNREILFDSVKMLARMGVDLIRIIRTTEAPRWQLNAANATLTNDEYYDFSAGFAEQYKSTPGLPPVIIWQSLYLNGERREYTCFPVKFSLCSHDEENRICPAIFDKPSVLANGEIIPCTSFAGYYALMGIHMENVKTVGLQKALTEGRFISAVTQTVGKKYRENPKCGSCVYGRFCQGGCPALSTISGGSMLSADESKCAFFFGGWYERTCRVLGDWQNLNSADVPRMEKPEALQQV